MEQREVARELRLEGLLPTPLDDPTACIHGCHGECLHTVHGDLSEHGCRFWCHFDGLPSEADYRRARAEHAAAIWPGGSVERTARESYPTH